MRIVSIARGRSTRPSETSPLRPMASFVILSFLLAIPLACDSTNSSSADSGTPDPNDIALVTEDGFGELDDLLFEGFLPRYDTLSQLRSLDAHDLGWVPRSCENALCLSGHLGQANDDLAQNLVLSDDRPLRAQLLFGIHAATPDVAADQHVVFVVDLSATNDDIAVRFQQDAILSASAAGQLLSTDLVTVIAAREDPEVLVRTATPGSDALAEGVSGFYTTDVSNLYAGLRSAIDIAATTTAHQSHIILITDGIDAGGLDGPDRLVSVIREAQQAKVGCDVVGVGKQVNGSLLFELAEAGSGRAHWIRTASELQAPIAEFTKSRWSTLASQATVLLQPSAGISIESAVESPATLRTDGQWELTLGSIFRIDGKSVAVSRRLLDLEATILPMAQVVSATLSYRDAATNLDSAQTIVLSGPVVSSAAAGAVIPFFADATAERAFVVRTIFRASSEILSAIAAGDRLVAIERTRTAHAALSNWLARHPDAQNAGFTDDLARYVQLDVVLNSL